MLQLSAQEFWLLPMLESTIKRETKIGVTKAKASLKTEVIISRLKDQLIQGSTTDQAKAKFIPSLLPATASEVKLMDKGK